MHFMNADDHIQQGVCICYKLFIVDVTECGDLHGRARLNQHRKGEAQHASICQKRYSHVRKLLLKLLDCCCVSLTNGSEPRANAGAGEDTLHTNIVKIYEWDMKMQS